MSAEQNKATYRRFVDEVMHHGRLEVVDELIAPDAVDHAAMPGMPPGREGVKMRMAMLRTAFPDLHLTLDDQVAEGETLANRFTIRGTNSGTFMGMPATGKPVVVTGIDLIRWRDGQIAEHWVQLDMLGLLQQLGVIPTPETAPSTG